MKVWAHLVILGVAFCGFAVVQKPDGAKPEIVLTKLSPPLYPPLARQARITGDVQLELKVRPDGIVANVVPLSGHPILQLAASDSAQKSQFSCQGCSDVTSYRMTYTFDFLKGTGCQQTTVRSRVRSPKCLYFWKCGERVTSDWSYVSRPQEVSESDGHVTVLASGAGCVEPEASRIEVQHASETR